MKSLGENARVRISAKVREPHHNKVMSICTATKAKKGTIYRIMLETLISNLSTDELIMLVNNKCKLSLNKVD